MRKHILTILFVLVLAVTGLLLVSVRLFVSGTAGFDDWVMRQVIAVAQTYLVPSIEFDHFRYTPPGTVTYGGVRLTSPDGTRVVDAGEMVVTLGEIPSRGKPIVISGVTIRDGELNLIATPDEPGVEFKGLVPFVKKSNYRQQESLPQEVRLSETLDLRAITLDNASVSFDPGDGEPPMRLDGMSLTINIEPKAADGEVWHTLDIDIDRGDLFGLVVDGRINLDDLKVDLNNLDLRVDVGSGSVSALPPQLQQILRDHDARGQLAITLRGTAGLRQWRESDFNGAVSIDRFNIGLGEYRVPIEQARIPFKMGDGAALLGPAQLNTLEGVVTALLSADIQRQTMPAQIDWTTDRLNLRELLRTASPKGETPKLAGILAAFGSANADLGDLPGSIDGRGEVHISKGRLVNVPGVREINDALDLGSLTSGKESLSDSFDIEFRLDDRGVIVDKSELETSSLLARGTGMVYYNTALDLRINAGPMEKVQSLLGRVGKAIGSITDQLVTYHVTGTVQKPKVSVKPLGFGL
ncbi:MAG: hypothetical protein H6813_00595 [Phycisphaeraceae bacterium]|nr:hypothetical protein [Phycisphaeraceae bacterium]MCB9847416.1 hypothetical protein [Phycisphaeraceae bacterium]